MPRVTPDLDFYGPGKQAIGDLHYVGWHAAKRHAMIPPHTTGSTKVILVIAGQVDVTVDGHPLRLNGERWALLPSPALVAGSGLAIGRLCWFGLHADSPPGSGPRLLEDAACQQLSHAAMTTPRIASRHLVDAGLRLIEAHQDGVPTLQLIGRSALFLHAIFDALDNPPQAEVDTADGAVDSMLEAITKAPAAEHSLDAHASKHACSRDRMYRAFRRRVGFTPLQYILWVRTTMAAERLRAGVGQREVASTCGFANTTTLGRAIRKFFNTTPGALAAGHAGQHT